MKKGLSILLVAAALFGFYGGATNLNDVLACKDYWEEAGAKSTADMNKLEDGLNQLKENEQAYLDGKDQVADGEKALADAEKQLADGEAQLADGRAELAKGEADYAAAPGKLADARKQIAKGEKDLAAGEKKLSDGYDEYEKGKKTLASAKKEYAAGKKKLAAGQKALKAGKKQLESLNTLIDGIEQVLGGYPEFKNGYKALRDNRVGAIEKPSDTSQLQAVLTAYYQNANDVKAGKALQSLQAAGTSFAKQDKDKFTNKQYDGFKDYLEKTKAALDDADAFFENTKATHETVSGKFSDALTAAQTSAAKFSTAATDYVTLATLAQKAKAGDTEAATQFVKAGGTDALSTAQTAYGAALSDLNGKLAVCKATASNAQLAGSVQLAANVFIKAQDADKATQVLSALTAAQKGLEIAAGDTAAGDKIKGYLTAVGTVPVALGSVNKAISDIQTSTLDKGKDTADQWLKGYAQITGKDTRNSLKTLTGGVAKIIGGVLTSKNDEMIKGMNAAAKKAGFTPSAFTPAATSKLTKDMASDAKLENFYNDMNKVEAGFKAVLPALKDKAETGAKDLKAGQAEVKKGKKALEEAKPQIEAGEKKLAAAKKQLAQGEKDLAAGKKKLASGKSQYAQGLADYKAAPGKLAAGRQKLAEGEATLADGYQEYEKGKQTLADGKAQLAQYEDGEQQVRDGLATLTGTEADLDLQSIADRLNGDTDFDNGDGHLELDEGLAAVEVGRGYQAEDGELITKEITARAVGTGGLLAAGVLAVLAAILSFLKKNKGAGVLAVLAAAAGAFGAFYGTNAGTYFSGIAGSTAGATGWIAAGILGAVALVHAIVHFTAKKEA